MKQTVLRNGFAFIQVFTPTDNERIVATIKRQIGEYLADGEINVKQDKRDYLNRVLDELTTDNLDNFIQGWIADFYEDTISLRIFSDLIVFVPASYFNYSERYQG